MCHVDNTGRAFGNAGRMLRKSISYRIKNFLQVKNTSDKNSLLKDGTAM